MSFTHLDTSSLDMIQHLPHLSMYQVKDSELQMKNHILSQQEHYRSITNMLLIQRKYKKHTINLHTTNQQ